VREILVARAVPSARRGRLIGFPTRELVQAFADRVQSILFGQVLGGDPLVRRLRAASSAIAWVERSTPITFQAAVFLIVSTVAELPQRRASGSKAHAV